MIMTQKDIFNIVDSQKWSINPDKKAFDTSSEYSEVVCFWNDDIAFSIHGVREKNDPQSKEYVIIQFRPTFKHCDDDLNKLDGNWASRDIKFMNSKKLLKDKELHSQFLKK
jgi:hypothetical protein